MIKSRGPRTEPCGILWVSGEGDDLVFCPWMNWEQSDRYKWNNWRGMPETPVAARRSERMVWDIVSKVALRSRCIRMARRPESAARRRSFVIWLRAISVLWLGQKPDWKGSRRLFFDRWSISWEATVHSITIEIKNNWYDVSDRIGTQIIYLSSNI